MLHHTTLNRLASKFGFCFSERSCRPQPVGQLDSAQPRPQWADRCIVVCSNIPHNKLASNLASISGNIPVELGQLVNLTQLYLYSNQLTGALWYVPSYHTTDWLLNLASISGNIPVELGKLVNLKDLDLSYNKLTGALWYVPSYHTTN